MIIFKIYSNLHEMNIESNRYNNNSRVPRMYTHTEGSDDLSSQRRFDDRTLPDSIASELH